MRTISMSEVIPKVNTNHKKAQSQTLHKKKKVSQLTFTCSTSTIETLEKDVKYVQSQQ